MKKQPYPCCSRKQTLLVVPDIKLPLTPVLTHGYKQDLIRIGTGLDAFSVFVSPCDLRAVYLHSGIYSHTWMCRGKHYGVIKCSLQSETEETDRVYHAWASNLAEIRSLWAHTLETQCTFEPLWYKNTLIHTLFLGNRQKKEKRLIFGPLGALETSFTPNIDTFSHYKGTLTKSTVANVHLPFTTTPYERREKWKES